MTSHYKGLLLLSVSTGCCFVIVVMVIVDYNQKVIFFYMCKGLLLLSVSTGVVLS